MGSIDELRLTILGVNLFLSFLSHPTAEGVSVEVKKQQKKLLLKKNTITYIEIKFEALIFLLLSCVHCAASHLL